MCIDNARRYIEAADYLVGKDIQSAYLLYLYSLEEMGKVIMVFNAPYHSETKIGWKKWQKRFHNHGEKFWFSKDLETIAKGRLAKHQNQAERAKTQIKLDVAYVKFNGSQFSAPTTILKEDLDRISDEARKRLSFLDQNHPSSSETEISIRSIYPILTKLRNEKQLTAFAENLMQRNTKYILRVIEGALIDPDILQNYSPRTIEKFNDEWKSLIEVTVPFEDIPLIQKLMVKHYEDGTPWYMDGFEVDNHDKIICAFGADDGEGGRIFLFDRSDIEAFNKVKEYAVSKGIPKVQIDFLNK